MENSTLDFNDIESPATGRHFPIEGRPFAMIMEELADEARHGSGWTGRIVR